MLDLCHILKSVCNWNPRQRRFWQVLKPLHLCHQIRPKTAIVLGIQSTRKVLDPNLASITYCCTLEWMSNTLTCNACSQYMLVTGLIWEYCINFLLSGHSICTCKVWIILCTKPTTAIVNRCIENLSFQTQSSSSSHLMMQDSQEWCFESILPAFRITCPMAALRGFHKSWSSTDLLRKYEISRIFPISSS